MDDQISQLVIEQSEGRGGCNETGELATTHRRTNIKCILTTVVAERSEGDDEEANAGERNREGRDFAVAIRMLTPYRAGWVNLPSCWV